MIEDHVDDYVSRERLGTGKPLAEASDEIAQAIDVRRFYAGDRVGERNKSIQATAKRVVQLQLMSDSHRSSALRIDARRLYGQTFDRMIGDHVDR